MTTPRVSVLMLTFNRPFKIGRAIRSVCEQSFESWELLVVQDGSNPQTTEIVSGWVERDPRVRYLPRGVRGPISQASNYGLDHSCGEYIAILDADDYWSDRDKLARQVEYLDAHPETVACGGGYILIDEEDRQRGTFLKPETDAAIRARALLANPIANSTAIFRRVIGGVPARYDEALSGYADWDF